MTGGSHTNFDHQAFTTGAVGGASLIAGALVAGLRNANNVRRERDALAVVQGRDDLIRSLQRRVDAQRAVIARHEKTIRDQAFTIRELELRLKMAQYLRQRRR